MRCALLLVLFSAVVSLRGSSAEALSEPGSPLTMTEASGSWAALFEKLASKDARFAQFAERRWFAVRKQPVELRGELRLAPDHGLSLHYPKNRQTMIVDETGVLLRDSRGRSRVVRPDDRAPAANTLLLPILAFDLAALEKTFRIFGARDGDQWRLDFKPRETEANVAGGEIAVHGAGDTIHRIELRPKKGLRIEIMLTDVKTGVTFSREDMQRFFR